MTEDKYHKPDTRRLEQLYRRAADGEPASRIDEAVLGKARRAASRPRRGGLRHPGAWGVGLAAAASLVLAVGLVFQYDWQPTPESEQLEQFRASAELEQADKPSAPAAGDGVKRQDVDEAMEIRESAEFNQIQVTGARSRDEAGRDSQESRKTEAAEARIATPVPPEEEGQSSPEAWLERIRDLAEAGELDEARQEMRNFRDAYPSASIPIGIREALAKDVE